MFKGEEAPLASQLNNWLDAHPGWEVMEESDDEDDDEQEDDESSNQKIKKNSFEKEIVEEKEPIKKTKMEDDEYKNASEEHTYYRYRTYEKKIYNHVYLSYYSYLFSVLLILFMKVLLNKLPF